MPRRNHPAAAGLPNRRPPQDDKRPDDGFSVPLAGAVSRSAAILSAHAAVGQYRACLGGSIPILEPWPARPSHLVQRRTTWGRASPIHLVNYRLVLTPAVGGTIARRIWPFPGAIVVRVQCDFWIFLWKFLPRVRRTAPAISTLDLGSRLLKAADDGRRYRSRLIVEWLTLKDRAMSVSTSPASRRAIASRR